MPCSSAAAITSASRFDPPGWITDLMPSSAITSRPSRNGKNASDAADAASSDKPSSRALRAAILAAHHPAHLPGADADGGPVLRADDGVRFDIFRDPPREQQILDLRSGRAALASRRARSCAATDGDVAGLHEQVRRRRSCIRAAARRACADRPISSTRTSSFAASTAFAARDDRRRENDLDELPLEDRPRGVAASSSRLKAMMPPKADVGSVR